MCFQKVVNSAALPDKLIESPMASLVNPAAVLVPPTALRATLPALPALATSYLNGQARYGPETRRTTEDTVDAASIGSTRSEAASIASTCSSVGSVDSCGSGASGSDCSAERPGSSTSSVEKRVATDFIFGKIIGEGSFSTVYLAKDIHTKREYASKSLYRPLHLLRRKSSFFS